MTRARRARAHQRGLTLLEVGLAVAILAMMATLTWGSIARSFDSYELIARVDDRYHNVRVAMNRMARELSMAYLSANERHKGRERLWHTVFRAKDDSPFHRVDFTAFAHQILRQDAKESDQCEISYYGESAPDERNVIHLMRREDPRPDPKPDEGGRSYVLAENVKDFKLRFFDPKQDDWTDEWDTEKPEFVGRLPQMVEIVLVIEDEDGQDRRFITKTRINLTDTLRAL